VSRVNNETVRGNTLVNYFRHLPYNVHTHTAYIINYMRTRGYHICSKFIEKFYHNDKCVYNTVVVQYCVTRTRQYDRFKGKNNCVISAVTLCTYQEHANRRNVSSDTTQSYLNYTFYTRSSTHKRCRIECIVHAQMERLNSITPKRYR
jgi:hypothetical protein